MAKGSASPGHGHGAAPDTKIIGHTMAGHTPHRADRRDPTRGHQGLPTGPWRHGVPAPAAGPRTPRTGYARVMDDHGILPPVGRTGACHTQRGDPTPVNGTLTTRTREPQGPPDQDPPESGT